MLYRYTYTVNMCLSTVCNIYKQYSYLALSSIQQLIKASCNNTKVNKQLARH